MEDRIVYLEQPNKSANKLLKPVEFTWELIWNLVLAAQLQVLALRVYRKGIFCRAR